MKKKKKSSSFFLNWKPDLKVVFVIIYFLGVYPSFLLLLSMLKKKLVFFLSFREPKELNVLLNLAFSVMNTCSLVDLNEQILFNPIAAVLFTSSAMIVATFVKVGYVLFFPFFLYLSPSLLNYIICNRSLKHQNKV